MVDDPDTGESIEGAEDKVLYGMPHLVERDRAGPDQRRRFRNYLLVHRADHEQVVLA